jgi:hypothetical protein
MKAKQLMRFAAQIRATQCCLLAAIAMVLVGCRAAQEEHEDFFTSGSREADQRAIQRMAREEQLEDGGESSAGGGEQRKLTLYERLGGRLRIRG